MNFLNEQDEQTLRAFADDGEVTVGIESETDERLLGFASRGLLTRRITGRHMDAAAYSISDKGQKALDALNCATCDDLKPDMVVFNAGRFCPDCCGNNAACERCGDRPMLETAPICLVCMTKDEDAADDAMERGYRPKARLSVSFGGLP